MPGLSTRNDPAAPGNVIFVWQDASSGNITVSSSVLHFSGQLFLECGKFSCLDFLFFSFFSSLAIKETHSAKKKVDFFFCLSSFKALFIVRTFCTSSLKYISGLQQSALHCLQFHKTAVRIRFVVQSQLFCCISNKAKGIVSEEEKNQN